MAKHWIAGAIKKKGALTAQAKKAGESPMHFAEEHKDDGGTTGKRARLAVTLSKLKKGKKAPIHDNPRSDGE